MKKDLIIGLAGGLVVGVGIGGGAVYAFLNKKYARALNEAIDVVSEEIGLDYARFYSDWQPKPPLVEVHEDEDSPAIKLVQQARAETALITEEMAYNGTAEDPEDIEIMEKNIFADEEARLIARLSEVTPDKPYLITVEEFMEPFKDHGKLTLTYFEEDDVLIEEVTEKIVDNPALIGSEVLKAFGSDPRDADTIQVRNESLEADFEVTRDRRSYAEVIAGYKMPAEDKPHRKPRREDNDG